MIKQFIKNIVDSAIYVESFFHGKTGKKNPGGTKRVLIMRKDGLGDCLLFYPTLGAYRGHYADAELTLIFPKWFEPLAPLLNKFNFDNIIWFDHITFSKSFSYRRRFLLDLKHTGYDIAIYPVVTREEIGDFMIKMSGAEEIRISIPDEIKSELGRNVYFAEKITEIESTVSFPTVNLDELPAGKDEAKTLIEKYGLEDKRFIIVFPGAGASYRIWPAERFAAIIDHVSERGFIPVISGSPKEKDMAAAILSKIKPGTKAVNLSGQTDMPTLAHIIASAAFYFGSDTGILHLATALDVPAIALMGSGGYRRFFPYGDLQKNRAVYDTDYMKKHPEEIGDWTSGKKPAIGEIHPSILGISVDMAEKELDYMLNFVK